MPEQKLQDWQAPPFESSPAKRQGWVEEQVQAGDEWWRNQPSSQTADANLALLGSDGKGLQVRTNSLKADVRKFVETISDIREIATFGGADYLKTYVEMFNRVVRYIYSDSQFPVQSRKALQYSVGLGRGYIWPRYVKKDFGWGEGVVEFKDLGPREVLPTQLPSNNDIQQAYATTIFDCMGIAEAHGRFSRFQDELQPISKARISNHGQVGRYEFYDRWKYGQTDSRWDETYCEIRYTYIRDLRINTTGVGDDETKLRIDAALGFGCRV